MSKRQFKVALYCRVAREDQLSLEQQEESLQAYAKDNNYSNLVSYLDNGYSGLDFNRPAFAELNKDIQDGKISAVIVRNETRIGRNLFEVDNWIDGLEKRGVAFITTDYPRAPDFRRGVNQALFNAIRSYRGARSNKKRKCKSVQSPAVLTGS